MDGVGRRDFRRHIATFATASDYNPRQLAKDIKRYFERNRNAVEVLIMKGARTMSVIREDTLGQSYIRNFMMKYRN